MNLKNILKKIKLSEKTISAVLGALVIVVVGILLFNFFKHQGFRPEGGITQEACRKEQTAQADSSTKDLPTTHVVAAGENLWGIAEEYYNSGYNWVSIAQANKLAHPNQLAIGQELTIPQAEVITVDDKPEPKVDNYTVQEGDSLWEISVAVYGDGYQWSRIYQANQAMIGPNPGIIQPGTILVMPAN